AVSSRRRRAASRSAATAAPTPAAQIISSRETDHLCCRCSQVPAADVAPFRQDRREGPSGNIPVILTTGRPAALEPGATARVPLLIYQARTMLQFSRAHWSGSSLQRAVLLFLLIAAVMLGVYYILSTENARRESRPTVAGFDEVEECGSLTSFDGT